MNTRTPRTTPLDLNVWDATQKRLDYLFTHFDHIYLSFSGGKDSGLLLNLCLQYMRKHNITRKIGVFHQDFEAQYTATTDYVTRALTQNLDLIQPYWCCLPMRCKTATSMHEQYWTPWHPEQRDIWVRPLPDHPGVITLDNHPFDFYHIDILQEDLYTQFTGWYHRVIGKGQGRTVGLIGIRTDESLNRWRAVTQGKYHYNHIPWTTRHADTDAYTAYPIYDWSVEDIWTAHAKNGFDYNTLYDLYHYAGLKPHEMRVASPFNDWAITTLKLYRVIEPDIWGKMVGRVNGANFSAIYGGTHAMGWKNIKLPPGHTWKSYVDFLLRTLPDDTRKTYEQKFATSIEFWRKTGGVLSDQTITELRAMNIPLQLNGTSNYKSDKQRVIFTDYPDDADVKEFQTVPSYKRMAVCILKNDHLCKYMGFSQTQRETQKRKEAIAKYKLL